jgi:concanavalin A-like lectin/glucanase superfamily protein
MHRLLVVVAAAGCGSVAAVPDDASRDAAPPDAATSDGRAIPDLKKGCVLKATMDEASWASTGRPVVNACGSGAGSVLGPGADTTNDPDRGRVGSFSMDACVDFLSTPELHGTTGLTMSAWVRPTGLNGVDSNGVISKRNDKNMQSEFGLFVWTGSKVYVDLGNSDRYEGTAALSKDVWSQLTAVFDSSLPAADRVRLFINGVADPLKHVTIGDLGASLPSYDSPLHVGCTPAPREVPPTNQTFQGQLDNVTIWNRALSAEELTALAAER